MFFRKRQNLLDLLKKRQKEAAQDVCIGRDAELSLFRENVERPPDERRWYLCNVHGQGGTGKTLLMQRFRQVAEEHDAFTAWSDEHQRGVLEVMVRLADELKQQGIKAKTFHERYKKYRQLRTDLEADPTAPKGTVEFIGSVATKLALEWSSKRLGIESLSDPIKDKASVWAGEYLSFIVRKFKKTDDVELLREPISVLTPLWLAGLREQGPRRSIVLFLDSHEQTSEYLDRWLLELLRPGYGEVPANILFAIAGQKALERDVWNKHQSAIVQMPLESFTEEQTSACLSRAGPVNDKFAADIFRVTQGLPVLVASLSIERASEAVVIDPLGTVLDCFLKGVTPQQRQLAVDAALPRRINRDVLAQLTEPADTDSFSGWLKSRAFVLKRPDGWEYHAVVRPLMLEHTRRESPERWAWLHQRLGAHYSRLQVNLGLEEGQRERDSIWQKYALEELYHRICESPHRAQGHALNGFLSALKAQRAFAIAWAETLQQAEDDAAVPSPLRWGTRLLSALKDYQEGRFPEATEPFTRLLEEDCIEKKMRAIAFNWRGYLLYLARNLEDALSSMSEAVTLDPDESEYLQDRSRVFMLVGRLDDALADLDRAIEREPDAVACIVMRCMVYMRLGRMEESITDARRLRKLRPDDPGIWAVDLLPLVAKGDFHGAVDVSSRILSQLPRFVQQFREGLGTRPPEAMRQELEFLFVALGIPADYARTAVARAMDFVQSDSKSLLGALQALMLAFKGSHYMQTGQTALAVDSFTEAIELTPWDPFLLIERARARVQLRQIEGALADYDRAVELAPTLAEPVAARGEFHLTQSGYEKALWDLDCAAKLRPTAHGFNRLSWVHSLLGHWSDALVAKRRASELKPDDLMLRFGQIALLRATGDIAGVADVYAHLAARVADFTQQLHTHLSVPDRALRLERIHNWMSSMLMVPSSELDLVEVLMEISEGNLGVGIKAFEAYATSSKAALLHKEGRHEEALEAYGQAAAIDPDNLQYLLKRVEIYEVLGRKEERRAEVERLLEVRPQFAFSLCIQALLFLSLSRPQKANEACSLALARRPEWDAIRTFVWSTQLLLGEYETVLSGINAFIATRPNDLDVLKIRIVAYWILRRHDEALADLNVLAARDVDSSGQWQEGRGEILASCGRYAEAIECHRQVLARNPENWRAALGLLVSKIRSEERPASPEEVAIVRIKLQAAADTTDKALLLAKRAGLEALAGNIEQAFEFLQQAATMNPIYVHMATVDPAWHELRGDPRFQALLARAIPQLQA